MALCSSECLILQLQNLVDLRSQSSRKYVYVNLKLLLGIRHTTCNDICLVEAAVGDAKGYIQQRQKNYYFKLINREHFNDSYVGRIINLAIDVKCPSGQVLRNLKHLGPQYDYYGESLDKAKSAIRASNATRRITYLSLNPDLILSEMYSASFSVPEFARISVTRLRTSSHRLKIETGRWARIPRKS